jgi:hypothetical protein
LIQDLHVGLKRLALKNDSDRIESSTPNISNSAVQDIILCCPRRIALFTEVVNGGRIRRVVMVATGIVNAATTQVLIHAFRGSIIDPSIL